MKREDCLYYETERCVNYMGKIECKDCQDYISIEEEPTNKELEKIKRGENLKKFETPESEEIETEPENYID